MKKIGLLLSVFIYSSISFSQILITDPDFNVANPFDCAANTGPASNFFDSGNTGANYSANENETITICPDYVGATTKISISFGAVGVFDVDGSDTIFVYDGPNTSATLLGVHNNITDPFGFSHVASFVNNPTGCLTVQFKSDAAIEGAGWDATINCVQPAQPFDIHMEGYLNGVNSIITPADTGYSDVCFGDSILFVASPVFPNSSDVTGLGYSQNTTNITYEWTFSNGQVSNNNSVWFTPPTRSGYIASLKIIDQFPYSQTITSKIRVSTIPSFAGVLINRDTICVGDTTRVIGAVTNNDTSGVAATTSSFQIGGSVAGQVYLPDGSGVNHYDTINIAGFIPGSTVTSISDLQQLCLDMEHSYLGDLELQLTCPNGTTIDIFNAFGGNGLSPGGFGGGGTYLGHPIDNNIGAPGIGEEYCWSSTLNTLGTFPVEFAANNFVALTVPTSPSAGNSMNWNGIHAPEQSFINLLGCPLNGPWSITVRDNLGIDDGFIFEWSILFDPIINPNNETYLPTIDTAFWLSAATVLPGLPGDTFIVVSSILPGTQNYTFQVTDNFGCDYDTTVSVEFNPLPVAQILPGNSIVCQNTPVDFDVTGNAAIGFSYSWSPGHNLSDSTIKNPTLITDTLNGTTSYMVTVTNNVTGCTFDTIQDITVVPAFTLNSIPNDTNICDGDIVDFSTTPSLPGNYTYNWTSNIGTLATPLDSATTGTFNISGSDTVFVTVTEGTGPLACIRNDTMLVNVSTIPGIVSTSPDTLICINGTATIYATPSGSAFPLNLIWNNGTIAGNGPHSVNPTASSTTYTVYTQDANNCTSDTSEIVVTLFPPIVINTLDQMRPTICKGDTTLLIANATGGGTGLIYTWYDGNNIIIGATDTATYIITPSYDGEIFTVIVSDSCTTPADTLTVITDWSPIILPTYTISDSAGCYIDLSFNPVFENTTQNLSPSDSSSWDFGNGTTYSWPFIIPFDYHYDAPDTYDVTLTITDQYGCIWDTIMDGIHVYAYDQPQADFLWNPNPTDYLNAQITFNNQSTNNFYNQWLFVTDAQYTSTDVNPVFQFPQDRPGSYDVTLITTTEHGCQDSITKVVVIDDVFLFYIPTAFTPDGDGLNDDFKVVGEGLDFNSFKMTVFNKWGELIFETSNPDNGWDGTYKGSVVPSGVYIWKIDAKEAHSPITHNKDGFITIMR